MLRSLLLICLLLVERIPATAQRAATRPVAELLQLVEQGKPDTSRVGWLLQLSNYYFSNPAGQNADLVKPLSYALSAEALSVATRYQKGLGDSYMILSQIWRAKQEPARAKAYINKAIQTFTAARLFTNAAYAWFELSGYYALSGTELSQRIHLIEKSVALFRQAGNIKKEADALKELADVQQIQGNFLPALEELKRSLQLLQSIREPALQGVYDLLGDVSCSLGNLNEAVRYGLLAVQTAEKLKDTTQQLCVIYNRLSITYYYLGEMELSADYLRKALSIAEKNKVISDIYAITLGYANILARLGRPVAAISIMDGIIKKYPGMDTNAQIRFTCSLITNYTALGQYNGAQQYFNRLMALTANKVLNNETQQGVYIANIRFLLATQQYKKVRPWLEAQEKFLVANASLQQLSVNQLSWFKLDSAEGNYLPAIAHYQKYKTLTDSIFNQAKSKQIAQLNIQYETDKKDKDILLKAKNIELLTRQSLLQDTNLRQNKLIKNIMLGSIALLLIIVGLLYSRYRLRQESSREINRQNLSLQHLLHEKEWLLKEIHHRVKNNFHMVMGLLGTQSGYLKSEESVLSMEESRHRIHAMSLIHQKLYQSVDLSAINMRDYIHELVAYLRDSFDIRQRILFKMDIADIELDLSHSVPLGLILNEAITNSIKYAFPNQGEGVIAVSLQYTSIGRLLLTISDNGIGLPAGFNHRNNHSMGMNLMQGLSEDIGGIFTIENRAGACVQVSFTYDDPGPAKKLTAEHTHQTTRV